MSCLCDFGITSLHFYRCCLSEEMYWFAFMQHNNFRQKATFMNTFSHRRTRRALGELTLLQGQMSSFTVGGTWICKKNLMDSSFHMNFVSSSCVPFLMDIITESAWDYKRRQKMKHNNSTEELWQVLQEG